MPHVLAYQLAGLWNIYIYYLLREWDVAHWYGARPPGL